YSLYNAPTPTLLYTLSLHDALPISISNPNFYRRVKSFVLGDTYSVSPTMVSSFRGEILRTTNVKTFPDFFTWSDLGVRNVYYPADRKSTRLNSSHVAISYAVFCLKK